MIRVKLINCDVNLKSNFGIDMQDRGSYDKLCAEMSKKTPYMGLEYDFPPLDYILLDMEDGMEIPNLTGFGEVESVESFNW